MGREGGWSVFGVAGKESRNVLKLVTRILFRSELKFTGTAPALVP